MHVSELHDRVTRELEHESFFQGEVVFRAVEDDSELTTRTRRAREGRCGASAGVVRGGMFGGERIGSGLTLRISKGMLTRSYQSDPHGSR